MPIRTRRGFTLIEILLVVAIIAVLAAMVVPRLTGRTKETKASVAQVDVEVNIPLALDIYELDTGTFPKALEELIANASNVDGWKGPYLKKIPKDSWGKEYAYTYPGQQSTAGYDLSSAGPDGEFGTSDDIGNWTKK